MKLNKELEQLFKQWEMDFKGDLIEAIKADIEDGATLKQSLEVLVNEHFPIWIEEAGEDNELVKLYKYYQLEFAKYI